MVIEPYYHRDGVTVYHADCLDVLPQLSGVDAVITDPPWGRGAGSKDARPGTRARIYTKFDKPFVWDDKRCPDAIRWIGKQDTWIVWGGNYFCDLLGPCSDPLLWHKCQEWNGAEFVLAWTKNIKGAADTFWLSRIKAYTTETKVHPAQKPLALMLWCIEKTSAQVIVDPFMGSGTTGVACVKTGRRFIGIEIEELYCEIAVKRLAQMSLFEDRGDRAR